MPQLDTYMYLCKIFVYRVLFFKYFRFVFSLVISFITVIFQAECSDTPWEDDDDLDFLNTFMLARKPESSMVNTTTTMPEINYLTSEDVSFKTTKLQQSGVGDCKEIAKFFNLSDNREFLKKSIFPQGAVMLEEELSNGSELLVSPIECIDKVVTSRLPHESMVHIKNMVLKHAGLRDDGSRKCWFSLTYDYVPPLSFAESSKIIQEFNENYKTEMLLGSDEIVITKSLYSKLDNIKK